MHSRRLFLSCSAAFLATPALSFNDGDLGASGLDRGFAIPEELAARQVAITPGHQPGQIHIMTERRALYFTLPDDQAIRYPIAVGASGRAFRGTAYVGHKAMWPYWEPTRNMIRREPETYRRFANGVQGGPDNPLGARALYLYRGNRDTLYRIHGTSQPESIGRAGSSGCIRMFNSHVADLYQRAPHGTRVTAHS